MQPRTTLPGGFHGSTTRCAALHLASGVPHTAIALPAAAPTRRPRLVAISLALRPPVTLDVTRVVLPRLLRRRPWAAAWTWLAAMAAAGLHRVVEAVNALSPRRDEAHRVRRAPLLPDEPTEVRPAPGAGVRRPGETLGNYELLERLDAGGMGEVWRARHTALGRPAAVKLIRRELLGVGALGEPALVQRRFEREARSTAALRSPHTVQLYDFGHAPDGTPYYAMELLEGLDLNQLVARTGPVPAERVVHIVRQICHSLAEAHGMGLIHRDIKPGNIRLTAQGGDYDVVKVLDFGLVKRLGPARDSLAGGDGLVCGTPGYLAPEAMAGESVVDARADLYAVGSVAFRLLTGTPVFSAADEVALLREHLTATPPAPSARLGRALPAGLDALVSDLLARDPAARPTSALDVLRRLDAIVLPEPWTRARAEAFWREHAPTARNTEADALIAVGTHSLDPAA